MTGRQGHNAASKPGEVGFQETRRSEPNGLNLDAAPDLSSWTPVQVDEKLADLYEQRFTHTYRLTSHSDHLARIVGRELRPQDRWNATASATEIADRVEQARARAGTPESHHSDGEILRYADKVNDEQAAIDRIDFETEQYNDEFEDRGGWTRAFLVNNSNGHVHSSMGCSTCFPTTRYHWMTEYSGADEAAIVEDAGERACTVCYPSAPVETLNKPTKMFTPDEVQAAKDREARAAAKAERDKKKIEKALTPDGSEFEIEYEWVNGHQRRESFKTEQAATTWLVGKLVDQRYWTDRELEPSLLDAQDKVKRAIADKHQMTVDEVDAMLEKKVKAKAKRDGWI